MVGSGEPTKKILFKYWLPETITQFIFIIFPLLADSYIVASLKSTALYGALGTANNLLHVLLKFSEAIPIGAVAIIGRHNGAKEYKRCGKDLGDTFWTSTFIGIMQFILIFLAAASIYRMLGVPEDMVALGVPFFRLRSFGILLVFIANALIYFMRGIKNTRTPMMIFIIGLTAFLFFDYVLVLGKLGFPQLGLYGAALATIIQYSVMSVLAIAYLLSNVDYKKYFPDLFIWHFSTRRVLKLLNLSWKIMIDKTALSMSYVWLFKLITPLGAYAITSFDVIKNLERFALLPAIAFAQVITFLVSNRLGAQDPEGAKSSIKKVLLLAAATTGTALLFFCFKAHYFVSFFDPQNEFTHIAAPAFILVSTLVVFDFIQLILAGALRGAGDVKTVMYTRFFSCAFFFVPFAYFISKIPIANTSIKFALIYSSFYINTAIIGFVFMRRIIGTKWQQIKIN
jgi:putative MATE family efflux protein